jgi:hypothetical protein
MTATNAKLGYGLLIKMLTSTGPDVYTTLGQMRDIKPSGASVDMVDATHNESDSATEEVIPGLIRTGDTSFSIHYDPTSATMALITGALRTKKTFREVYPDGRYVQYDGYFTSVEPDAPTEDKMVAAVTLKRSGPATPNAASAPTNSVLPAISGLLDEDDVLTAYEGVWANEPTSFTYQWKNAGVNINGATSKTYAIQASDAGDAITVAVTATNSAGSATATSAAVTADS